MVSSIYSSVHRIDSGNGFDLIFLRNVCYDAESMRLILFTDLQDNSKFSSIMKGKFTLCLLARSSSSRSLCSG